MLDISGMKSTGEEHVSSGTAMDPVERGLWFLTGEAKFRSRLKIKATFIPKHFSTATLLAT